METITLDAQEKVLGRLASEVSVLLRKNCRVLVRNIDKIKLTGKKANKPLIKYTGYLGGLKTKVPTLKDRFHHAVFMMLPKNKERRKIIKNLVFYGEK